MSKLKVGGYKREYGKLKELGVNKKMLVKLALLAMPDGGASVNMVRLVLETKKKIEKLQNTYKLVKETVKLAKEIAKQIKETEEVNLKDFDKEKMLNDVIH